MHTTDTMTAEPVRYSPLCPDWCTSSGYRHEENTAVINGGIPIVDHEGPTFGIFFIDGTERLLGAEALEIRAHGELADGPKTVEDLRKLAADALAAAEWLEARA